MTDWHVALDGGVHNYQADEPPEAGKTQDLGGVLAHVEEITTGADGEPLNIAKRAVNCAICGRTTTDPIGEDWKTRVFDPDKAPFYICPDHKDQEVERFGGNAPT